MLNFVDHPRSFEFEIIYNDRASKTGIMIAKIK